MARAPPPPRPDFKKPRDDVQQSSLNKQGDCERQVSLPKLARLLLCLSNYIWLLPRTGCELGNHWAEYRQQNFAAIHNGTINPGIQVCSRRKGHDHGPQLNLTLCIFCRRPRSHGMWEVQERALATPPTTLTPYSPLPIQAVRDTLRNRAPS